MKRAAVGFRVHSGWVAVVALAPGEGASKNGAPKNGHPIVLVRRRIHLVKNFTYEYRQPYHTAARLSPDEGRVFVARVRSEARRLALRAMLDLKSEINAQGYLLTSLGLLLASGRPLPALPKILASHSIIHTADGELFREALLHAAARTGLKPMAVKERELIDSASRVLRRKPADLTQRISDLGRPLGPPWSQDEKLASLVAWLAASSRPSTSRSSASHSSPSHSSKAREAR